MFSARVSLSPECTFWMALFVRILSSFYAKEIHFCYLSTFFEVWAHLSLVLVVTVRAPAGSASTAPTLLLTPILVSVQYFQSSSLSNPYNIGFSRVSTLCESQGAALGLKWGLSPARPRKVDTARNPVRFTGASLHKMVMI